MYMYPFKVKHNSTDLLLKLSDMRTYDTVFTLIPTGAKSAYVNNNTFK